MKKVQYSGWMTALLLAGYSLANAQSIDSLKIVTLQSVQIIGRQVPTSQQLASFYKTNAAATVEDILARLPEVALVRRGSYGMEPTIRSFNAGQINVLIDGMVMHGACTDKMDPITIYVEPINLDQLQLQTGTQGMAKGSAIGGMLDMKMAAPSFGNNKEWHGSFSSGYQSVSKGWHQAGVLQYSSGRWAFRGSGTYRTNQNYTDGNGQTVAFSTFHKTNFSLAAAYQYNPHTTLKADLLTDDGWDMGYPALPMDVGSAKARLAALTLTHAQPGKPWYSWEAKLYANRVTHKMDDSKRPDVAMHMDMPGVSKTAGFYAEASARLTPQQSLQLRFDGTSTFLSASMTMYDPGQPPMYMLTWPDNRRNQTGLSASWQWKPDSVYTFRAIARADAVQSRLTSQEAKDYIDIVNGNTDNRLDLLKNLSLTATRQLAHKWQLQGSAAYAERMPTASELYGFYLFSAFDRFDYIGNTRLKTEKALNTELSLVKNTARTRLQFTGFYTYLKNPILGIIDPDLTAMTIGALGVKVQENLPYAHLLGGEASMQWKLQPLLTVVSTMRYTWAQNNRGLPMPLIAPLKNVSSFRYASRLFWAQVEYEASLAQNRVSKAVGEKATPAFVLAHARMGYTLKAWQERLSVQAGVENIFNAAYREHLDWGPILRPGRNVYMQVKCSF